MKGQKNKNEKESPFYDTSDLLGYTCQKEKVNLIRERCVFMDIRKSALKVILSVSGLVLSAVPAVLYCFAELSVPAPVYAAAWSGCIAVVLAATSGLR